MSADLLKLLEERVIDIRPLADIDFIPDPEIPLTAISVSCLEIGLVLVILPTIGDGFIHVELHAFRDGGYLESEVNTPRPGFTELTLRTPVA